MDEFLLCLPKGDNKIFDRYHLIKSALKTRRHFSDELLAIVLNRTFCTLVYIYEKKPINSQRF